MLGGRPSLVAGALGDLTFQTAHHLARFQKRHGGLGKGMQLVAFPLGEFTRLVVHDRQRADGVACRLDQRHGRQETHRWLIGQQRILGKPRIEAGIGNHQYLSLLADRVGTVGGAARDATDVEPDGGFDPQLVAIQKAEFRNGCAAYGGRQPHDVVKERIGIGAEHVVTIERFEPRHLVDRNRGIHASSSNGCAQDHVSR